MVPSRSRKTAGRDNATSGRTHLRANASTRLRKPRMRRRRHTLRRYARHAPMIRRTSPQKTRRTVRLLLHDRALRRHRRRPVRVGRPKNRHDRQSHRRRNVHRPRIIPNKKLASRKQRRQFRNRSLPRQIDRLPFHPRNDRVRNRRLPRRPKQNNLRARLAHQSVRHLGKSFRQPAFRRSIRSPRPNRHAQRAPVVRARLHTGRDQFVFRRVAALARNRQRNLALPLNPAPPNPPAAPTPNNKIARAPEFPPPSAPQSTFVSKIPRPSRAYPMRSAIPARQASQAASNAFCSSRAASNFPSRNREANRSRPPIPFSAPRGS